MKCIRILIVLMAIMFGQGVMFAQEGGQTEDTHAHSESHKVDSSMRILADRWN